MRLTAIALGALCSLATGAQAAPAMALVEGPFPAPPLALRDPVSAARFVLSATPETKGAELVYRDSTNPQAGGIRVVRFRQHHLGVPVIWRGAGVALRPDGSAAFLAVKVEERLPASVAPGLSAAKAAALGQRLTGLETAETDAALGIFPTSDEARLAWVVYPSGRLPGLPYAPVVVLDAMTGERLAGWNAAVFLNQAQVYATNPVKSPSLINTTLPVGSGQTTLSNGLIQSLNCIDKKTVRTVSFGGYSFPVHACDLVQTAVADAGGDYLYPPPALDTAPEDVFAEVSMFHHANRVYQMFQGLGLVAGVATKPLPTVSNLRTPDGYRTGDLTKMADPNVPLVPFGNAFFAPANPIFSAVFGLPGAAMWFGQGPNRDFSYDGDVVYHELTHAVVDSTLQLGQLWHHDDQGLVDSPGAMNEGLADYFSSALAGDPQVGEYAVQDFAPGRAAIRDLSNSYTCPARLSGEVHSDSEFFSAALWATRAALINAADQQALDAAFFAAMAIGPNPNLGYEDLANLFVTSVKSSSLGQAGADLLSQKLTERGVLPACKRVIEYAGNPVNGPDSDLQYLFFAPGTDSVARLPGLSYAPGLVQIHAAVPAGAIQLAVGMTKSNVGGGGNPMGGGGTPFAPQLAVRWGDAPISFTYAPGFVTTADQVQQPNATGNDYSLVVAVPAGATSVYAMVLNGGTQDGAYKNVRLDFLVPTPPAPPPDPNANAGSGGEATGCHCGASGQAPPGLLALGLLLLALPRRARD